MDTYIYIYKQVQHTHTHTHTHTHKKPITETEQFISHLHSPTSHQSKYTHYTIYVYNYKLGKTTTQNLSHGVHFANGISMQN